NATCCFLRQWGKASMIEPMLFIARKGIHIDQSDRQFRPQFCRSEDFNECLVLVNADLQAKFLGMTTNNDRYPCLSRHLTERLR
ncbi:hypothetical protein, partial [Ruegeria arenilitoris]|uniref:hypothetical protein n=1 Tax=Ruegeria arenilitoris TaxID=1173585 RepID=UPI001C2C7414